MERPQSNAVDVARRLIDALERRDPEGVIAFLHDDIVLELPYPILAGENTTGTRRQSGKAVHAYLHDSKALTARNKFNNVIWKKIGFNDAVWRTAEDGAVIFQADGECKLSNGAPYRNRYIFKFEVSERKIWRWSEYLNPVISARAIGISLESIP